MTGAPWSKTELMPCPSAVAYRRHVRRDEPIDDACRQAYNAAARRYRATKGLRSAARVRAFRAGQARAAAVEALIELHPVQFQRLQLAALKSLTERGAGS